MFRHPLFKRIKSAALHLLMTTGLLSACSKSKHAQWETPADYYALPRWADKVYAFNTITRPPHTCTLFIGDSITEGLDLNYFFGDSTMVNMGIGGDFTEGILRRLLPVQKLQPRKIFLLIGINDVLKRLTVDEISSNHLAIIKALQIQCPLAQIHVQSLLPIHRSYRVMHQGRKVKTDVILDEIKEINQNLAKFCQDLNLTYVDLHPAFCNHQGQLLKSLSYDGLHLDYNGNQVWTNLLRPLLD